MRSGPDFGSLAPRYDRLRPADESWAELLEALVVDGDLLAGRVLDVGSGTGRIARALAERGAHVWGIDPSAEMLAEARAQSSAACFERASAESLPFGDASFDRAVLRLVVHLVDRARALPELVRVLAPGGRAVIATFRPEHIEHIWLNPYFPSIQAIDLARFPAPDLLVRELKEAGFADARWRPLTQRRRVPRAEALERIRGRFISTLRLVPESEFHDGLERAERDLPEAIDVELAWAIVVALALAPDDAGRER